MVTRSKAPKDVPPPWPAAPEPERMSLVDTAWLRMDAPTNLMMIVGVWIIKPGVHYPAVCQRLQERLLQYPRFGQRVVRQVTGTFWVTDEHFEIAHHVVRETLPPGAKGQTQQALQDRLAALVVQPLDQRRPLWQFHLIEHYQGGSALIARIHHCIADGIALIAVTQSLVDRDEAPTPAADEDAPGPDGADAGWVDRLLQPFTAVTVHALEAVGDSAAGAIGLLRRPRKSMGQFIDRGLAGSGELARLTAQALRDAAALALMPDDSPTRLKGTPGQHKRVAWCQPIPLAEVKAVSRALNCSVNDVLLSCVAGALGGYLESLGDKVAGLEIRAMVPVNLRRTEAAYQLGNQFGLAPLVLPIGIAHPLERVYEVRRRMGEMKGSLQPLLTLGLLALAGLLTKPGQDAMLSLFSKKTTAVMTNVPGPREKLKFLGATLEQDLVWVPQSGTVGLGVSILSYGGGVQFGVISDAKLCPAPQKIIERFAPEFSKLTLLALMLPWSV